MRLIITDYPDLGVEMGGMRLKNPLPPTVYPATYTWSPVEAECVVDDRVPATEFLRLRFCGRSRNQKFTSFRLYNYANPTSLNKEDEGRIVKDTDAGDVVSVKTPGGRQRETYFSQ